MTEKQREIIIKSLLWFITGFIIIFIGVNNVFAVEINATDYATKYYWGTADSTTINQTDYRTGSNNKLTLYSGTAPTYANSETFNGFYNRINYSISKGSIYTLSLSIGFSNLQASEWGANNVNNRLLSTDFAHCSNCTITAVSGSIRQYNSTNQSISGLYDYVVQMSYTFVATSNASTWYIGSYTGDDRTMGVYQHSYTSVVILNNLNISNDNSSTIINQNDTIINQNQQMIDQSQQNTEDIINNNDSNTQDIINNNNQNTQDIINSNKENFQSCEISTNTYNKSNITKSEYYLNNNGEEISNSGWGIIEYIEIEKNISYNLKFSNAVGGSPNFCLYNSDKTLLSCTQYNNLANFNFNSNNAKYISISFPRTSPVIITLKSNEEICTNKLDEQNKTSKGILGKLGELITNLFSTDGPDTDGLDNVAGWLPPGPIDSILTLPLSLINAIINGLGSNCIPLSVNLPFVNNTLQIPCINVLFSQISGVSTLYAWFGPIASAFILYYYFKSLYKWVDEKLSLKDSSEWGGV